MKRKKLSRREAMLIRHALARYERTEEFTIWIDGHEFMRLTLAKLRDYNRLCGRPANLSLYYNPATRIVLE